MHVVILVVCRYGGGQFAGKPTFGGLAPAHHKPVTAMPVFSSDV